jgi:hypothetical protein
MSSRELSSNLAAGALALGILAALPAVSRAQSPQPGPLFHLSSCTGCAEHGPVVAGNGAGDFLTAWDAETNLVQQEVMGRLFDGPNTPLGGDFEVQAALAEPPPPQFDAAAATDAQGNFILTWATLADDESRILAQRYDAKGNPLGAEILVAADAAGSPSTPADFKPAVAATPDGGFVVAWVNQPSDPAAGPTPRVMSRRFAAGGAAVGAAVQVSTGLAMGERPSLCVSFTGRVHVAWTFADAYHPFEPNLAGVVLRRFEVGDVPTGPEQVVAPALDSASSAAISCGPGNNFVVVWQTAQAPAVSGSDIVAQRFTRRGRALGAPFLVNQLTDREQKNPALATDASGNFVVVWEGNPYGVNGVRGRRFTAWGQPLSDEFLVFRAGRGDLTVLRPAIAATGAGGGFVVVVDAAGGVFGRHFTAAASARAAVAAGGPGAAEAAAGASTGNGRGAGGLW